ncbi:hypothetical protein J4218_04275 [Candidatus Pacearchaeota archaeon]|nr:hypothetical protein [Candidatus Pacearchaeota archaeon]
MEEIKEEVFDYDSLWNKEYDKKQQKIISDLPRGLPRTGIKGKYLKKKVYVGRKQLKNSWGSFYKTNEGKDIVSD